MKQLKSIQVPKQSLMLDKFSSEKSIYSDRNFFLNQYRTINRLLKLNYPRYYKYNYNLYMTLKKFIILNVWRLYIQPLVVFNILTPFYRFTPQIQLKEYIFYKNLGEKPHLKQLLLINKKRFTLTPFLAFKSKSFIKQLPGGLNGFFLTSDNKPQHNLEDLAFFQTSVMYKLTINKLSIFDFNCLLYTLNSLFFISLSNYSLLYQQFILNVIIRL